MSAPRTGFGAMQQAMAEQAAKANFTGSLDYFKCAEGETKVVRFLTDDVITDFYAQNVTTAKGSKMNFLIPDLQNNLLLRYAKPGDWDGKTTQRTAGVMVLRSRIPDPAGPGPDGRQRMKVIDHIETREDGTSARQFFVAIQGHNNFWDQAVGYFNIYNTLCDRDYAITRRGQKLETKYTLAAIDPSEAEPQLQDIRVVQENYGYGKPWDKDDPNRFWWCPQTLQQWREEYASEKRIQHFMVAAVPQQQAPTGPPPPSWAQPGATPQAPPPPAPPNTPVGSPQDPWQAGQQLVGVAGGGGVGEFHPATTSNPVQPPPAAVGAPPAPVAPTTPTVVPPDQDFANLRERLAGHKAEQQQQS